MSRAMTRVMSRSAPLCPLRGPDTSGVDTAVRLPDRWPRPRSRSPLHGLAPAGQTSLGGCYGFPRHLGIHDQGEWRALALTPGHGVDRHRARDDRGAVEPAPGGPGRPLPSPVHRVVRARPPTDHPPAVPHAESAPAAHGPGAAPLTGPHRIHPRLAPAHLAGGAYPPSASRPLPGASVVRVDGLRSSAPETGMAAGTRSP